MVKRQKLTLNPFNFYYMNDIPRVSYYTCIFKFESHVIKIEHSQQIHVNTLPTVLTIKPMCSLNIFIEINA